MARQILDARVDELLLEGRLQIEAARLLQRGDRTAQELAHAAFPRSTVRFANIAEEEVLRCGAVAEIHMHLSRRIRHDHEIAGGAERRVEDRTEAGLHQIGMGPADAGLSARRQFGSGKPLAAHQPGNVAGSNENEFFAQHAAPLVSCRAVYAHQAL